MKSKKYIIISSMSAIVTGLIHANDIYNAMYFFIASLCLIVLSMYLYTKSPKIDIKEHQFWWRLPLFLQRLKDIDMVNPLMKKLLINVYTIELEIIRKHVKEITKQDEMSLCKYRDIVNNITNECNYRWHCENYPKRFIKNYLDLNKPSNEYIQEYLCFVFNSKFYSSSNEKKTALLDVFMQELNFRLINLGRVLQTLNGEVERELVELRKKGLF